MAYLVAFEDEYFVRLLLKECLEAFGHSIDVFPDGSDDSLQRVLGLGKKPDLFLVDFNMPGRNGLEVLTMIRTEPKYDRFSTVPAMGIGDFPNDKRDGLVDCYPKVWTMNDLNNRINAALQSKTG